MTYTIGTEPLAKITVEDNDDPALPKVSIVAASSLHNVLRGLVIWPSLMSPQQLELMVIQQKLTLILSFQKKGISSAAGTNLNPTLRLTPAVIGNEVAVPYTVAIDNDDIKEPDGKILARVANTDHYSISSNAKAEFLVEDDEELPVVSIAVPTFEDEEHSGTTDYNFVVSLSHATTEEVVINFTANSVGDTATLDDDYRVGNDTNTLTFPANSTDSQSINIKVVGDTLFENQ